MRYSTNRPLFAPEGVELLSLQKIVRWGKLTRSPGEWGHQLSAYSDLLKFFGNVNYFNKRN